MQITVTDAIRSDHVVLRKKLQEVRQKREEMSSGLESAYRELHAMNDVHMNSEERFFYAALKEHASSRADALESLQEHHLLRVLEREMDGLRKSDEEWKAKFGLYAELSNHHFDEEEEKLFGELQKETAAGLQRELGREFELSEKEADAGELSAARVLSS